MVLLPSTDLGADRVRLLVDEPGTPKDTDGQLIDDSQGALRQKGPIQLVFAGKAHPRDEGGKVIIRRVSRFARELREEVPVVYFPNHRVDVAKFLVAGVDVWLNTPQPPLEASGTSE